MKNQSRKRLLLLAALGFSSATARAQSGDSAVAQALFDQAKQLLADGHAAEACPKLEESQRLDPRSGTLINLARCYELTGHLASAWSKYIDAALAAKASGNLDREAAAREHAAALMPRLSKLTITVAPALKNVPGLEVTRDRVVVRAPEWDLALPSDPGVHEVTAKAPGRVPFDAKVTVVGEGQTTTVSVPELAKASTPAHEHGEPPGAAAGGSEPGSTPGHGLRTVALVAGGIGIVGVGLGTAFGLMSKSKHDSAAKSCSGTACTDTRAVSDGDAALRDGNISTAMMIVGGVGLATGLTLWLAAPKSSSDSRSAQLGLGLGTVHVKAAF